MGFIVYLVFALLFIFVFKAGTDLSADLPWLLVGAGLSLFGAEVADYDQLYDKLFHHRDILTHSSLLTGLLTLLFLFPQHAAFAPYLLLIYLGHASHLFLDLLPVWAGAGKMLDGKKQSGGLLAPARWFIEGVTGSEIYKKLQGTYLIHLPFKIPEEERHKTHRKNEVPETRKTLEVRATRAWLVLNGLLDLVFALIAYNSFSQFLPFPT